MTFVFVKLIFHNTDLCKTHVNTDLISVFHLVKYKVVPNAGSACFQPSVSLFFVVWEGAHRSGQVRMLPLVRPSGNLYFTRNSRLCRRNTTGMYSLKFKSKACIRFSCLVYLIGISVHFICTGNTTRFLVYLTVISIHLTCAGKTGLVFL